VAARNAGSFWRRWYGKLRAGFSADGYSQGRRAYKLYIVARKVPAAPLPRWRGTGTAVARLVRHGRAAASFRQATSAHACACSPHLSASSCGNRILAFAALDMGLSVGCVTSVNRANQYRFSGVTNSAFGDSLPLSRILFSPFCHRGFLFAAFGIVNGRRWRRAADYMFLSLPFHGSAAPSPSKHARVLLGIRLAYSIPAAVGFLHYQRTICSAVALFSRAYKRVPR